MTDKTINNIRISYDETDERVRNFIIYFQSINGKKELKDYLETVKSDKDNQIYLSDNSGNEFILKYLGGHNCSLGLRGM